MIVYDASKKVTGNNNELMKGCLDQINEDNEDVLTFYSSDSDDENDNQQFCFSMLCTDDDYDCDDEAVNLSDEENEKPNQRPTPPEWSLTINRKSNVINQTAIDHRVIDKFFGCEYESVDMLEIFPKINPKRAKRRKSSMKWDTPLRHSVLPKYWRFLEQNIEQNIEKLFIQLGLFLFVIWFQMPTHLSGDTFVHRLHLREIEQKKLLISNIFIVSVFRDC